MKPDYKGYAIRMIVFIAPLIVLFSCSKIAEKNLNKIQQKQQTSMQKIIAVQIIPNEVWEDLYATSTPKQSGSPLSSLTKATLQKKEVGVKLSSVQKQQLEETFDFGLRFSKLEKILVTNNKIFEKFLSSLKICFNGFDVMTMGIRTRAEYSEKEKNIIIFFQIPKNIMIVGQEHILSLESVFLVNNKKAIFSYYCDIMLNDEGVYINKKTCRFSIEADEMQGIPTIALTHLRTPTATPSPTRMIIKKTQYCKDDQEISRQKNYQFNQDKVGHYYTAMEYKKIGNEAYRKHRYQTAIESYTKALHVDQNFSDAFYNRGLCFLQLKKFVEAEQDFLKVLKFNPHDNEAKDKLYIAQKNK